MGAHDGLFSTEKSGLVSFPRPLVLLPAIPFWTVGHDNPQIGCYGKANCVRNGSSQTAVWVISLGHNYNSPHLPRLMQWYACPLLLHSESSGLPSPHPADHNHVFPPKTAGTDLLPIPHRCCSQRIQNVCANPNSDVGC